MARAVDVIPTAPQANGWNMITNARTTNNHPSLANGPYMSGLTDGANTAAGCPGGSLGTGMNASVYVTPTVET